MILRVSDSVLESDSERLALFKLMLSAKSPASPVQSAQSRRGCLFNECGESVLPLMSVRLSVTSLRLSLAKGVQLGTGGSHAVCHHESGFKPDGTCRCASHRYSAKKARTEPCRPMPRSDRGVICKAGSVGTGTATHRNHRAPGPTGRR